METWNLNGYTLEYDDESHTYIVDGVIVPSVTQVIGRKFGNKYDAVAPAVLKRASERGTAIHKAIEKYCRTGEDDGSVAVRNFKFLKKYYGVEVLKNEIPVIISLDGTPLTAGRLDLIINVDGYNAVADIKTTATLDKEYLAYQLNLYRLGVLECYPELEDIKRLYGIHLKEHKRTLAEIPINEDIALDLLEEVERGNL